MDSKVTKRERPTLRGKIKAVPRIDGTLTKEGWCADAKAVGDALRNEQRAVNFAYSGTIPNATTIEEALNVLNDQNNEADKNIKAMGKCELLTTGVLDTLYDIDTSKYRFIYYELQTSTGLCMISNTVPVAILKADVQEFNHTEYATANYNAEITVQVKQTGIKAYKKSLTGWNLSVFKVYGIY